MIRMQLTYLGVCRMKMAHIMIKAKVGLLSRVHLSIRRMLVEELTLNYAMMLTVNLRISRKSSLEHRRRRIKVRFLKAIMRIQWDLGSMTHMSIWPRSKHLTAGGVFPKRKRMTRWVYLDSQRLYKRTLDQASTISSNSQSAWRWWKASCSRRPCSRRRTEESTITKSWSRNCLQRPRVSMPAKRRDMSWKRNTWQAGYSLEPISRFSNRVISDKPRSWITSSSSARPTQRSKQITSLTTRIPRLAQAHMKHIQTLSNPRKGVGQTQRVSWQNAMICCSMATRILDPKSIRTMPNRSMPRVGRQTLEPLEPLRGSLHRSMQNSQHVQASLDRAATLANNRFRRNMPSER